MSASQVLDRRTLPICRPSPIRPSASMPSRPTSTSSRQPPGEAEDVGEVDVGRREVVGVAPLAGEVERDPEVVGPTVVVARGRGGDAERVVQAALLATRAGRRGDGQPGLPVPHGVLDPGPGGREAGEPGVHAGGEVADVPVGEQVEGAPVPALGLRPTTGEEVDGPEPLGEPRAGPVVGRLRERGRCEPDRLVVVADECGGVAGAGQQRHAVVSRRDLGRQVRGPREARLRLGEGEHLLGRLARHDGRVERPRQVARAQPVPRQLAGVPGVVPPLEHRGGRRMQAGPLAGQEPGIDDLAECGVPEADALVGPDLGHVLLDRRAQRRLELPLRPLEHGRDGAGRGRPPEDRHRPEQGLRLRREGVDPALEELAQGRRQPVPRALEDEVLDEERVAGRPREHRCEQVRVDRAAGEVGHEPRRLRVLEAAELDPPGRLEPPDLGEPPGER